MNVLIEQLVLGANTQSVFFNTIFPKFIENSNKYTRCICFVAYLSLSLLVVTNTLVSGINFLLFVTHYCSHFVA